MVKKIITEISEEDFRKLDLRVYAFEKVKTENGWKPHMAEIPINAILDGELEYILSSGYESDYESLLTPVTIAIHEPPSEKDYEEVRSAFKGMTDEECHEYCVRACSYLDKFMNNFTGPRTFQIGFGIRHLYSTRDYYEAHEDYWRVSKRETKVIYRIKLSESWINKFVLKHKREVQLWPYNELPDGVDPDYIHATLDIWYDRDADGHWVERNREGRFEYGFRTEIIQVDKEGKRKEPEWKRGNLDEVKN